MADTAPKVPKESHAYTHPTEHWDAYQAAVKEAALRAAGVRERALREQHDDTAYARRADTTEGA